LEIGPLASPCILKSQFPNSFYADIRNKSQLEEHYKGDSAICDIDFVILNSYTESLQDIEKFDYVIAKHVLEHFPRLIYFFNDISNILCDNAFLCLTIPDKRFCFDYFRSPTSFAEAYYIYANHILNNPIGLLDFSTNYLNINDPYLLWQDKDFLEILKNSILERDSTSILESFHKSLQGSYFDSHFSVFTPNSFLLMMLNMTYYALLPFNIVEFYYSKIFTFDFTVILQHNLQNFFLPF
jgi:hypothetical protein